MITAWVSYFIAIAENINAGMNARTAFGKYELINILLVVIALMTPMYVRLNWWRLLEGNRYHPTDQVIWIPNVVGFLTLVVTAYLAKGMA